MSPGYEYDPEYGGGNYNPDNCGDVSSPLEVEIPPETNEYTGGEYTDSLGGVTNYSKNITQDVGIDLNDSGSLNSGSPAKGMAKDDIGEDLNKANTEQLDAVLDNFQEEKWNDLSFLFFKR